MKGSRSIGWLAVLGAVTVLFVATAIAPVAYGFLNAFREPAEPGAPPLWDSRTWRLLGTSAIVATGVTATTTVLGIVFAFGVEYVRVRGRRLLWYGAAVAFLLPPYVSAIAWIEFAGTNGILAKDLRALGAQIAPPSLYSVGGSVLVMSLGLYPVVAAAAAAGIRRVDMQQQEAAILLGGGHAWRVTLSMAGPSIATGSLLVFLLSVVSFAVPSLLQVQVLPVEIFSRFTAFRDARGGMLLSLAMVALGFAAWGLWRAYAVPRRGWLTGDPQPRAPHVSRPSRLLMGAACCGLVAVSTLLPLTILVWRSMPLRTYADVWRTAQQEFLVSAMTAAISATVITVLGLVMAHASTLGPKARVVFALSAIPFLASGPALGIGLIAFWNHGGARAWVYDSAAIIVVACVARYLVVGYAGMYAAFQEAPRDWRDVAEMSGSTPGRYLVSVAIPLAWPWVAAVWGLSFLLSFGEVDTTAMVTPPGVTTLPMRIYGLMHYGPSAMVAALCVIMAGIAGLGAGVMMLGLHWAKRRIAD